MGRQSESKIEGGCLYYNSERVFFLALHTNRLIETDFTYSLTDKDRQHSYGESREWEQKGR